MQENDPEFASVRLGDGNTRFKSLGAKMSVANQSSLIYYTQKAIFQKY